MDEDYSLRDKFAGQAMAAIISNAETMRELTREWKRQKGDVFDGFSEVIASLSYDYADAMMKQRKSK